MAKRAHSSTSGQDALCSSTECVTDDTACFWNKVTVSQHPVVIAKINRMRRKDTDSKLFRELMYEVGTFLAYEATAELTLTESKDVPRHYVR